MLAGPLGSRQIDRRLEGRAMIRMRRARRLCAAGAAFALAAAAYGCASPQIDRPFDGLNALAPMSSAQSDPARLFVIHGMTTTQDDYADGLVRGLAARLGLSRIEFQDDHRAVPGAVSFGGESAEINLRVYHLSDGGEERMRVTALNWSPLTASVKQHQFASDNALPRAVINGLIKTGVINDGLGDATLYLGSYQTVMRRGVMMGLCAFLDGAFVNDRCIPAATARGPVALISESLGSYMLFDAIEGLNRGHSDSPAGEPLFSRLRLFYMFANQIPLLELSELKPRAGALAAAPSVESAKLNAFLDRVRRWRAAHAARPPAGAGPEAAPSAAKPLEIVAFTDPNDLLSYELSRRNYRQADADPHAFETSNVLYPNATAWLGLFADPLTAHTGYSDDPEVLDLVSCGTGGCGR
jgi:hypothetical protein